MLNLNSSIDMDFKTFLRWWKRELSLLMPEKLRLLVNSQQGFIVVKPIANQFHISYINNGESHELCQLSRTELLPQYFQELLASDEKFAKANVLLRLTGADALLKEVLLPIAAKDNIQQVLVYELDRYTPFKTEQVYFAVKPLETLADQGLIRVMLVLTTRELLDGVCEDLKSLGIAPIFADYDAFANDLDYYHGGYNLLPERYRQKTAKTPGLIQSGLIGLTALLGVSVLVLPLWFQQNTVNTLTEKVQRIEKEAKKIKQMQAEVDAVIKETQELLAEKNAMPPLVVVLNTLSTIIKDDTSLAYMQYADGHLQIQGESPAASTLIGVLEESELFNNARFVSPVTQDTISKLERFQITVDVTKKSGGDNHGQ